MRRLVSPSRDTLTLKQNALKGAEGRPAMNEGTTIGMDLGDKSHEVCVLNTSGEVVMRRQVTNTKEMVVKFFKPYDGAVVVVETGTHSPWIARELEALGCTVLVGNARKLRAIWMAKHKSDVHDAEMLARIARVDRAVLYPVHHRGEAAQQDLAVLKARDILVATRSDLVNHVRSTVKASGHLIAKCSTDSFAGRARVGVPPGLMSALLPVIEEIEAITVRIRAYDKQIVDLIEKRHPDAMLLSQVPGVGPVTSLGYVLSLEEADRFKKSRLVGAYLGLTPRRDQSGQTDKQLRITKAGDEYVRRLLVGCSHYILGSFGPDCDLRRFGLKLAARGGKNAKRRAVVAVARKLSVLLHRLWVTGAEYDPDYRENSVKKAA
jgi:transposase